MKSFALAAAATLMLTASAASATVYIGSHSFGTTTVNVSLTTDGTTGVLSKANVTAYSITLNNNGSVATLTQGNSAFTFLSGTAFQATTSDIGFDFSGVGHMQFDSYGQGGNSSFCLTAASSSITCNGQQSTEYVGAGSAIVTRNSVSGRLVLGTSAVAGVPEPATWGMMLIGFGSVGYAMRRRPKPAGRIRFA